VAYAEVRGRRKLLRASDGRAKGNEIIAEMEGLVEKKKVGKKVRSRSEEGSSSSSSSDLSKKARIGACAQMGGILDDMDVFNGIKKKSNSGSKKKKSGSKKKDSDSDSDSDSDDERPIRMARYGKVKNAEDVLDEELDEEDVHILESLGERFDILYNRLPSSEKAEIKERIKNAADGRKASIFGDYPIMPAIRSSRLDKEGRELQVAATNIAAECEIAMKHLANMEMESAGIYLKDIMSQAARLGTKGSIKRLYVRKPEVAKVLEYENEVPIYTDQMKRDFKALKENYANNQLKSPFSGFGIANI
jgi:hypothetical protein